MSVLYKINEKISTEQFIELLKDSTLSERRPVDDVKCMEGMLKNSNLTVSAWESGNLIGISRCVTDFSYCCYLSDLAVSVPYQGTGVGKQLQVITQQKLGPRCKLILIAAPAANDYYGHIGYNNNERCWILEPEDTVKI